MYAEQVMTPHERRLNPGETQQPLLDVLSISEAKDELATAGNDADRYTVSIAIAERFSRVVHDALRYKPYAIGSYELNPDFVMQPGGTNCYGYTETISECLSGVGIDHKIAFCNSHAFILLGDTSDTLYLIDSLSPELNGPLKDAVGTKDADMLNDQLGLYGKAAVPLFSQKLLYSVSASTRDSVDTLLQKHHWTTFTKAFELDSRNMHEAGNYRKYRTFMSVYTAETGRWMLEKYTIFCQSLTTDNAADAATYASELNGLYPHIDPRNAPPLIGDFVRRLASSQSLGDIAVAESIVTDIASSFVMNQYFNLQVWLPDMLRSIGTAAKEQSVLMKAITEYQSLKKQSIKRDNNFIDGKIAKATRMLDGLPWTHYDENAPFAEQIGFGD